MRRRKGVAPVVQRAEPRFSRRMRNLYKRILENVDKTKTNNYAEAAHRRCKQQLNMAHPGLWRFFASLQSVQRVLDYDYHQHTSANASQRKKKVGVMKQAERLRQIAEEFGHRTPIDYLRGIALN